MITILLNIFEIISISLGILLVLITYIAGKKNSQNYLYLLSLGFGVIALGSLFESILSNKLENYSVRRHHLLESIFVNIGFIIIWYALKEEKDENTIAEIEHNILDEEVIV